VPLVRRLLILGALGALAAAIARRLRIGDVEEWIPPEGLEDEPAGGANGATPLNGATPANGGTLEREGPKIGDEDLAAAITFPDDATLRDRVETELFRDPEVPKGLMNVDAAAGVITLRGTVDAVWIEDLPIRAGAVEGVVRVENLLTAAEPDPSGDDTD
jgi:hypothetical protein